MLHSSGWVQHLLGNSVNVNRLIKGCFIQSWPLNFPDLFHSLLSWTALVLPWHWWLYLDAPKETPVVVSLHTHEEHSVNWTTLYNQVSCIYFVESIVHVIYQKWHAVFHPISRHREVGWKTRRSWVFEDLLWGVWISEETLSGVFDLASQMNNDSWRNSKTKFAKFYGNLIVSNIQTTCCGCDFLCLLFTNY